MVWTGEEGTALAGNVGLQSLDPKRWIWDGVRLPLDDIDFYFRKAEEERRLLTRTRCFLSAEVLSYAILQFLSRGLLIGPGTRPLVPF